MEPVWVDIFSLLLVHGTMIASPGPNSILAVNTSMNNTRQALHPGKNYQAPAGPECDPRWSADAAWRLIDGGKPETCLRHIVSR